MFIIFGIIGLIAILVEEFICSAIVNTGISGLYIIVIPIGALVLSYFLSWMIVKGVQLGNSKKKMFIVLFSIIVGAAVVPVIEYTSYKLTYVDEDYTLNMKFQGVPLSSLSFEDEKFSFKDYIDYHLETDSFSLSKNHFELGANANINKILLILNFLSFLIGTPLFTFIDISELKSCEKCNKYYTRKKLLNVNTDCINNETFKEDFYNPEILKSWINEKNDHTDGYYIIVLYYCKKCNSGKLIAEKQQPSKKSFEHCPNLDIICSIDGGEELSDYVKTTKANRFN